MLLLAVARQLGLEKERRQAVAALKQLDSRFDEKGFDTRMREGHGQIRKVLRELTARW